MPNIGFQPMSPPAITEPSQPGAGLLVYGPLTLDRGTRILTGPLGWCALRASEVVLMELLMQPRMVPLAEMLAASFPPDQQQPRRPQHALAMRLARMRAVFEQVGVNGDALKCHPRQGYGLGLGGSPARTYTGRQIRTLDRLIATHPDRALVAELEA